MHDAKSRTPGECKGSFKSCLVRIYSLVAILNLGAWGWAILAFGDNPALLGIALVIYGLGLRHAVDADHIAAIDNVTRKLMHEGQKPVSAGFHFAIGHSAVVTIVTAAVACAAAALDKIDMIEGASRIAATAVSALFLFVIAIMNIFIFRSVYKTYRHVRAGGTYVEADHDPLIGSRGLLASAIRPLFRLVTKSWHMFPLGFLFGLGFDTATEVAMFGVSVSQAAKGVSFDTIMVFPVLFAAGMSLVDTTDGVMMIGAYDWAFVKPVRKLFYNMTITAISVAVALLVGGIEALGLIGDRLGMTGAFWSMIGSANENSGHLGFAIVGVFVIAWIVSFAIYKVKRLDEFEVAAGG